jgi:hypothetical protein
MPPCPTHDSRRLHNTPAGLVIRADKQTREAINPIS